VTYETKTIDETNYPAFIEINNHLQPLNTLDLMQLEMKNQELAKGVDCDKLIYSIF